MNRFIATDLSPEFNTVYPQAPADAETWVELFFPKVEDLLQQLAIAEDEKRHARQSLLAGSWTVKVAAVIAFICVPGCSTAAMLLMKAGRPELPPISQDEPQIAANIAAKADRLALMKPAVRTVYGVAETSSATVETLPVPIETIDEPILPEGVALRGSIENVALTTSMPAASAPAMPAAAPPKTKRAAIRVLPVKPAAEPPAVAPSSPSLFEKLFSVIASVTQFSQQPNPRQT